MTFLQAIASLISSILPTKVQYYAMLDFADKIPCDSIEVDAPNYVFRISKVQKEDVEIMMSEDPNG